MIELLKSLANRWKNWVGDADMERAIRRHLSDQGYFGGTAKLRNVRLVAVQRPGWLQVYRFDCTARLAPWPSDEQRCGGGPEQTVYHELYGLVREDQRRDLTVIRTFEQPQQQAELLARWSDSLVKLRGARSP